MSQYQTKYKHLFFDLDHTIWDFDKNAEDAFIQYSKYIIFVYGNIDNKCT
ncbi:hypothetical protein [Mucilaginibacter sp.]